MRAEHRDHEGREQIAREGHGADRDAELVALDRILHHDLGEAGHRAEAEPDHHQQHLEPDQVQAGRRSRPARGSRRSRSRARPSAAACSAPCGRARSPTMPALMLSAIMKMIRVRPAAVGVSPMTFCRYCGMKMLSATIERPAEGVRAGREAHLAVAQHRDRDQRLGAVISRRTNRKPDRHGEREQREDRRRGPGDSARRRG